MDWNRNSPEVRGKLIVRYGISASFKYSAVITEKENQT